MARPRKKIDPQQVERLAEIGCTTEEIASVLGCSKDTLERRFAASIKSGRDRAKTSLRRWQFKAARGGNVTMLIWLGKQLLGQSDKQQVAMEGTLNTAGQVVLYLPDNGRGNAAGDGHQDG